MVRGIRCSSAQGTEESWIKVGYSRNLVIKDPRAVGDGTVSLAKRTTVLTATDHRAVGDGSVSLAKHTTVFTAKDRRAVGDGTVSLAKRTTVLTAKDIDG